MQRSDEDVENRVRHVVDRDVAAPAGAGADGGIAEDYALYGADKGSAATGDGTSEPAPVFVVGHREEYVVTDVKLDLDTASNKLKLKVTKKPLWILKHPDDDRDWSSSSSSQSIDLEDQEVVESSEFTGTEFRNQIRTIHYLGHRDSSLSPVTVFTTEPVCN